MFNWSTVDKIEIDFLIENKQIYFLVINNLINRGHYSSFRRIKK